MCKYLLKLNRITLYDPRWNKIEHRTVNISAQNKNVLNALIYNSQRLGGGEGMSICINIRKDKFLYIYKMEYYSEIEMSRSLL